MSNTNKVNVPEAKGAMNRFKMEIANEGGQMVKKMIEAQERQMSGK